VSLVFPCRPLAVAALLASFGVAALPPDHVHPPEAADEPPLTLRDAVARTLQTSPELAVFPMRRRTQEARVSAAALAPAPQIETELENAFGTGRARGLDASEATFSLSQVIELGGQRRMRVEAARGASDVIEQQRAIAQLEVVAEVSRRFIHVASDQKQIELTELATRLARNTVTEVDRRVKAARSPEVELHRARIALARAQVEQEHAEHELLTSRRKLAAMWGARNDDDFGTVRADLFALPQVRDYDALSESLSNSPDFLFFATEARQRDAEIRLAEAKARSPITVSAGARWLAESDDAALVAGASMPLFGRRHAQPAIDEARALRESLDAERAGARVKAEASLFELVQELRHGITEAEVLRDQVLPQMQAALEATEYAWQRGRYGYLEWTEAQRERVAVQRALIEAAAKAHLFQVEIERLTGASATADVPDAVAGALR
jgi:cobalt-zinc-cadmium efflux system outer membrane protein